jgi:hypothetical protein
VRSHPCEPSGVGLIDSNYDSPHIDLLALSIGDGLSVC